MTGSPETTEYDPATLMRALEILRNLAATPPTTLADWKSSAADLARMRGEVIATITPQGRRTPEFREFKGLYDVFRSHYDAARETINGARAARLAERDGIVADMEALTRSSVDPAELLVQGRKLQARFDAITTRDQGHGEAAARVRRAWDSLVSSAGTVPMDDIALAQRRSQLKLVAIDGVARSLKMADVPEAKEAVDQIKAVWRRIGPSGPLDQAFDQIFADHCRRFDQASASAHRRPADGKGTGAP